LCDVGNNPEAGLGFRRKGDPVGASFLEDDTLAKHHRPDALPGIADAYFKISVFRFKRSPSGVFRMVGIGAVPNDDPMFKRFLEVAILEEIPWGGGCAIRGHA
jgi:hypothetical protein